MTASSVLVELVIVLGTAAVVTVVFQAVRLPVVLGYVLAGMLIGPHVPVPLVADPALVHVLSELGVILLMFTIGLELRLPAIARIGLPAGLTALFEVGLAIVVGTLVAGLLGFDTVSAVFVGGCLGVSSTMLVAKAFEELGWKGGFTEVVFAILVFEDLIAILLLAIFGAVASGTGLSGIDVAILLGKLAGFLALMLVAGLLVVPRCIRWIHARARPETLLVAALAVCFAASVLAATAGYSVALGAFLGGILIAESGRGHEVFAQVRPFRDVFAMVFFVSIGMTIEPSALAIEAPAIAAFAAVVLVAKPVGVAIGVFLSGHGVKPAVRAGLSLAQIGELSFVIANIAPAGDHDLLAIAVGVSCATTLTSPLLVRNSERIADWLAARLPGRLATYLSFYEGWLVRLRARPPSTWKRLRRSILVLVLDAAVVVAIVIAAATLGKRLLADAGVTGFTAGAILVAAAALMSSPFTIGLVRRATVTARRLATEVIPVGEPLDLGRAARGALVVTFEIAIGFAIVIPSIAVVQPFVPASPIILVIVAAALFAILRRSIADFEGHVRAGSELLLEVLSHPETAPLAEIDTVLPGFGGTETIVVPDGSPAIDRSLADLDLRARTGATVLAIARAGAGNGLATPSPTEPLRAGDILAVAGSADAIASARALLDHPDRV